MEPGVVDTLSSLDRSARPGAAFLAVPPREVLFASDYDGTIAPIVDDPASAAPLPGIVERIAAVVPLVRAVAARIAEERRAVNAG